MPNAVPGCNTFCVRDIQETASTGCHSAFSGLECCSEKGKKTFQPESANPQLWREVESRPNLKMIKTMCLITPNIVTLFVVEISATKGDRDLVLFSLIKNVAPKKEKKLFETKYSNLNHFEA